LWHETNPFRELDPKPPRDLPVTEPIAAASELDGGGERRWFECIASAADR